MSTFEILDDAPAAPPKATGRFEILDDGAAASSSPGYVEDIAKAVPSRFARGVAGVVGIPGTLKDFGGFLADQSVGRVYNRAFGDGTFDVPKVDEDAVPKIGAGDTMRADKVQGAIEGVAGPLYEPKTLPGQIAGTLAEFAPGALFGSGGAMARAAQVAVPAIASETAGQLTKGTPLEPYARFAGAAVGGVGTALGQRTAPAERVISKALEGVEPQHMAQASDLMARAQQAGIPLTWDEALSHVSNGANRQLTNLRRVVQNSEGGAEVLNPFMAERPGQIAAAAPREFDPIVAGRALDSAQTGQRVQQAANTSLRDTQSSINAATRPDYDAATRQSITPAVSQALEADPLYAQALQEVRGDPALNRTVANLPNDNVGVVDLVQRRMREAAENARMPGQANTSNLRAANLEDARTAPLTAAEAATGGPMGDYARAREAQAALRQNVLAPLEAGPLGTMRGTADVRAQGSALLPDKPAYASEIPTAQAMGRLVTTDPEAAANLVHNHLRTAFAEATQNLPSGQNAAGGARFAAIVRGNGQQAANLQTAVEQLPNGAARWQGLNRFLDILEATGHAPAPGSMTSFNTAIQKELGKGGLTQSAVQTAGTGGIAWIKKADQYMTDLNAGRNSQQIARILTAPNSGRLLERLAALPPGSSQAGTLALRLAYMGKVALTPQAAGQKP